MFGLDDPAVGTCVAAVVTYFALGGHKRFTRKKSLNHIRTAELEHEFEMEHMDEEVAKACPICNPDPNDPEIGKHIEAVIFNNAMLTTNEIRRRRVNLFDSPPSPACTCNNCVYDGGDYSCIYSYGGDRQIDIVVPEEPEPKAHVYERKETGQEALFKEALEAMKRYANEEPKR